jgi:hypothetical protein
MNDAADGVAVLAMSMDVQGATHLLDLDSRRKKKKISRRVIWEMCVLHFLNLVLCFASNSQLEKPTQRSKLRIGV